MRKIVQISTVLHDPLKSGKTESCVTEIFGLCDDGTLWVRYGALNTQGWVLVEGVPQGDGAQPVAKNEVPRFSDSQTLLLMAHARRLPQKKILASLKISVEVYDDEVASILAKLGARNMESAVTIALAAGFIPTVPIRQ